MTEPWWKDSPAGLAAMVVAGLMISAFVWGLALTVEDRRDNKPIREVDTTIASQCVAPGWRAIPVPGGWTGIEDARCK